MVLTTEWAQVEVIDLINDGSGLAFGIIGGRSTGVVVKTILPGGVADRDGRLQSGDHILQIGEVNLRGLGSEQVASVLRQCGVHVRMVVARPVESATTDYQTLGSQAPIVPTKILGDPVELDRHLLENGYAEAFASHPPATYTPFIFTGQQTDIQLHPISGMVDVVKDPLPIGAVPVPLPILQSTLPKMLPLDMALHQPNLPETEIYTVELKKDDLGLGITVAGYVCEKEEISGIFVKSISKGSAADLTNNIKMNDRIIEVDGISVIGFTNHQAVELLRNSGPMVKIKVERYLRGPKYEKLQQAIRANELRPPSPPSPTVSSLPKVPLSLVHMSHLGIEPEGDSRTSFDFDSAVILDATTPANGEEEKEIVIGGTRSLQFSISSQELIYDKWREKLDKDVEVVIAQMHKEENYGLGISLEGTVDVEDGKEVRPHHYIRNILPDGPVGRNGVLQSGDELLEVNGIQLLGLNHIEVVSILKQLPNYVSLVCARYPVPIRVIDTSQHLEAFQARKILAGSLQTLIASGGTCCVSDQLQQQSGRLVKAKSETSIASSMGSDACTLSRSRSLELIEGLPMWSEEHTVVELNKGDHGLGFSILDYQDPLNPQETVIVIRSLVPGGVAQYDGRLIPGDRLMAVNDVNVEHATLDAAVQVLKGAPKGVVKIAVAKPLNCQGDAVSQASQDTEDDHTCLEDFQECIEDFQECLDSVHICIDEDNSFNHSSCNSQVEDFGQKPPTHQAQKNRNLVLNSSDHFLLFESPITTNCLNLKVNRDSLGDSDADISFKSTNDSSLDNKNNSVVREINSNDINNCNVSDKPSSLSEKDGYETCLEETSLSEERTVRMNQKNLIFIETESSKLDDNTIKKKVQITNAESSSDVTPTNTFRDQFFIDLPPFIPSQNQNPKQTCTATSEPCLNREAQFQNTHHLCLDTKIEDGLKSYDQNAEDNCGDEFFLVQYPPDSSKEVSKSVSEPNVLETYGIPVISNRLTYRRCLREYYNDYQDCLEAYRLSCIGTTDTKECKVRNEMSDEDIFRQIFLPFKSKSAPNGMDSSFVTLTYDPGPDMGRRKSAFVPGYDFKESEMTVVRHIDPEYGTMKEYKVDDMLPKHWGSTQTVKVFREPNKSLGISIVGGKVDILPTEKSPNALLGIFVKNVVPNSPAGKTNKFKTGDRILEVSGIDLRQASHDKAVQAIRNASNPVTFVIQSLIPWANSENGSNKIYNGKNYESPTYLSPIKKPKTISPSNQQQTINNQNEANRSNTDSSQQYNNSNDVKSQNDTSATNQNYLSTSAANEENEFKVEANESSTVANAATSNKDGAADSDSDDDEDEEDVRELEGRTVSAKGHQIDRASAANVKRSKDEIAADAEPEDDFGYTMRYYDHEENKTIMNPWKVAKIFIISGTFIFDMLSLLPWLIHYGLYFFFRVDLPVLAYLFVLKVCRYPYWLKQMREIQLYYRMPSYLYKALRILISYFIVWIWSTAIIIFVNNRNDTHERSAEELLLLSLRSTQLLLNIGYGLKAKKTLLEIWLTILFTCFGFVLQLFLFINVLQFWQKYYSVANQQNAMNREVQEYLRYKGLPPLLRRKIFFYFDFKFRKRFYKEKTVFNIFSHRLKQEISITIARPYLIQVTRFFHLPKDFDAKIVNILSKEVYLPDDVIIRAGTEGDRLYMILYGTVAVYKPSGLEICHLQDGSYFGEVAVVLNVKRAADVIAVTACELYIIKKDSFREILRPFPSLLKTALDIAREKYIETTTRNSVNYELIADSDS